MPFACFLLTAFCLAYYLVVIFAAGITADAAFIWPLLSVLLFMLGLLALYDKKHPGTVPAGWKVCIGCLAAAGLLLFLILFCLVVSRMSAKGEKDLEYVVVLGAQVRGEVPSRALRRRLEKAVEYAEANPDTVLILTGGRGGGEDITEAECMRRYLTEHNISEDRLVMEEESESTMENLRNADSITGCMESRTGILSNNFHVYRAVKLASKMGYKKVCGIAADSVPSMQLHFIVREILALVKEKIVGNI